MLMKAGLSMCSSVILQKNSTGVQKNYARNVGGKKKKKIL